MNLNSATEVLQILIDNGLKEVVVCPGARNAPFVEVLSQNPQLQCTYFFDERSASFFAIGRIKKTNRPVAVITTSGTAVAELLPATIEAFYSSLPLILLTADRPKAYRNSGAPQSIEQANIFNHYVSQCLDLEAGNRFENVQIIDKPLHINICFDEPLLSGETKPLKLQDLNSYRQKAGQVKWRSEFNYKKPLIILSQLSLSQSRLVTAAIDKWDAVVYREAHSNVRLEKSYTLQSNELFFQEHSNEFDVIIRLGGVPTLRFWRDLEKSNLPVLNFSDSDFRGLSRLEQNPYSLNEFVKLSDEINPTWNYSDHLKNSDQALAQKLSAVIEKYPLAEASQVFYLRQKIGDDSQLFLGNSLPIRQWDLVNDHNKRIQVYANRGCNGIDGELSTAFGLCETQSPTWILLGDLTTLYDLQGLWVAQQNPDLKFKLVVLNNSGGQIFKNIFNNQNFTNKHELSFSHWAKMFGVNYTCTQDIRSWKDSSESLVLELKVDEQQSQKFWQELRS